MKKVIVASVSAIALMGLAACSDTDTTTTQGLPADDGAIELQDPGVAPADDGMEPLDEQPAEPIE